MSGLLFYTLVFVFLSFTGISFLVDFSWSYLLLILPLFIAIFYIGNKKFIVRFFFITLIIIFSVLHTSTYIDTHNSKILEKVGEKVSLIGVIDDEPDVRENLTIYRIYIKEYEERVRIFLPHYPEYFFGDHLEIYGTLDKPDNFTNENDIEFNYVGYLAKDDIYTTMYYPKVSKQETGKRRRGSSTVSSLLFSLKHWLMNNMQRWLPSPHAPLSAGLILGAKQSLGKDLLEKFRIVGLIHIVVLSGYNVTIIANTFVKIFSFLPRVLSFSLSVIAIIFFAIMTGASATIVRASVMAGIVLFAEFIHKKYSVNRALFIAAVVMVYLNPRILLYDPGFQLSFVATLSLVHLGKVFSKFLKFLPDKFEIREITASTLATQIAVLPLLVSMTGEVSVVALIVNLLVLPTVPLAMFFGFLPSLMFIDIPILGFIISLPAYLLLSYEIWIVEFFAKLPFATYVF